MIQRHCETCKYWEPPNGNGEGRWGACLLLTHRGSGWRVNEEALIDVHILSENSQPERYTVAAELRTTADFGCTEYEPFGETNGKGGVT